MKKVIVVKLTDNQYDSLCFMTSYNKKYKEYISSVEDVKKYLMNFVDENEKKTIDKYKIDIVVFCNQE